MKFRVFLSLAGALVLMAFASSFVRVQGQSDLSPVQRLEIMRQKLESMRRSLDSAVASMNARDTGEKTKAKTSADDPRERLRGLDKEVGSVLSEVSDLRGKQDRSEKYDPSRLGGLEASVVDLNTRVEAALQQTASARAATPAASSSAHAPKKKKGRFFGLLGGGGDEKYAELTGTVAPGRDRVLFQEAAQLVRKGSHETGRLLFTTIINTYPDSQYLPLAKLAIADSFYLEGTTSALIQAAQHYQDWLTFFPTDGLADDAMLKVAESEMRQMGLSDRDISHARKAEQRLKALLQQFPNTPLRRLVEERLREAQENLALHHLQVARFYFDARHKHNKGGLKGSQSRLGEIVEKYPFFCLMDEVIFRYGVTYQEEEEPDEAAKYFQQLLRDYPNSEYAEKAREQLNVIGAPIPDPDPIKKNLPACPTLSFTQNLLQQVTGSAGVTTDKNGILISREENGTTDLIDKAIANNGQLPANETPVAPVRTAPARTPPPAPVTTPGATRPRTTPPAESPKPLTPATPSATPKP